MVDAAKPSVDEVASAVQAAVRLLVQRLRQTKAGEGDDLTSSETSALARLDRTGPTTSADLARLGADQPAVDRRHARRPRGRVGW